MIGLSTAVKDAMLGCLTNQPLLVGLFDGETEIDDPRYERLPIEFSEPQDDGDIRFVENVNEVRFDDMGRDHVVDHWGVFSVAGDLLALYRLKKARELPAEDNAVYKPGSLSIGMP